MSEVKEKQNGHQKVVYIHSPELIAASNQLPKYKNRATLVNELIVAYGLSEHMQIRTPTPATPQQLKNFHAEDYVELLRKADFTDNEELSEEGEEYGLGYDCPCFPKLYEIVVILAGATITAAQALINSECTTAINWSGGWHHAKKDEAAGFCYVNDIVLGILELKQKFRRILYIDFDLHHGDGVEEAFAYTPAVFCFSVHKYEAGFYPGTGSITDIGFGKGCHYSLNLPLKDGVRDQPYSKVVCRLLFKISEIFKPDAVVCQCGADTLQGDPMSSFNMTLKGLGKCIKEVLMWKKPTLLLGGGGYNFANTARCWAYLTSLACDVVLDNEIPDHAHLLAYGPDYELHITPGNRTDCNTPDQLNELLTAALDSVDTIS